MSKFTELIEELEYAIDNDCDYQLIEDVKTEFENCRDELCEKCGKYREAYLGACDDCRYKA